MIAELRLLRKRNAVYPVSVRIRAETERLKNIKCLALLDAIFR